MHPSIELIGFLYLSLKGRVVNPRSIQVNLVLIPSSSVLGTGTCAASIGALAWLLLFDYCWVDAASL